MAATTTTFQAGTYTSLTDTFNLVLDLNDRATFYLDTLEMPQPPKADVRAFNIRTPGEVVQTVQYKNRTITATLWIKGATATALLASCRSLIAAIEQPPYTLRLQLPGGTQFSYADVVKVTHDIPFEAKAFLAGAIGTQKKRVHIIFECRPGLRGARQTLSNMVTNPGFEAPSGPGVQVFNDTFASVNAYSVTSGSAPTVTANVMTIAAASQVAFGAPAWGAIQQWQIRFKWVTGLTANFFLHYTDANNNLYLSVTGAAATLFQQVGGTQHQLGTQTATLTNGNFYWMQMTQFPTVPGNPPNVQAQLFNDNAGAIGTQVAALLGPFATFDALTALSGRPQISATGAALAVGGAFNNVHILSLFGPGGWLFNGSLAGTAIASGAWDTSWGNPNFVQTTYPNGPVTSFGSCRMEAPPAGTWNCRWNLALNGVSPVGTSAMPVQTVGNVIQASAWVQTTGMGASSQEALIVAEYDASGNQLRTTTVATHTGNLATWTQLSGSVVTGASCAYVDLRLNALDTSVAGASANATVWWDNVQCWDQTRTGMATMSYHELRFLQSPAQLLVSGLVGDMKAPAIVECGLYINSWSTGHTATVYLGRRLQASIGAQLIGTVVPIVPVGGGFTVAPKLDATTYGGFTSAVSPNGFYLGPVVAMSMRDAQGVYRMLERAQVTSGTPTSLTLKTDLRMNTLPAGQTPFGAYVTQSAYPGVTGYIAEYYGATITPFSALNTWTTFDGGQVTIPPASASNTDLSQLDVTAMLNSAAVQNSLKSWLVLVPVDGELAIGNLINPSNGAAVTQKFGFLYFDAGYAALSPATTWSIETAPIPVLAHAIGTYGLNGPGTVGAILANSVSDPGLWLDPTVAVAGSSPPAAGVNQLVVQAQDDAANTWPIAVEMVYSPQYLYPL